MSEIQYTAGLCNIGEAEIEKRRRIGYLGLALTIISIFAYLSLIYFIQLNPIIGIFIFIPALMLNIGFIQARNKFCAAYGFTHQQNVSSGLSLTIKIEDNESQMKDRNKATKIIFQSIINALIITIAVVIGGIIFTQLGL
ncbi:MAG: hypothetical protein EAX86_11005 [Candidatus Heimdallarchaeota archaeon]|nr:hypothetical protein [Candidatus Heimdallarchaeota archaeon]